MFELKEALESYEKNWDINDDDSGGGGVVLTNKIDQELTVRISQTSWSCVALMGVVYIETETRSIEELHKFMHTMLVAKLVLAAVKQYGSPKRIALVLAMLLVRLSHYNETLARRLLVPLLRKLQMLLDCSSSKERFFLEQELNRMGIGDLWRTIEAKKRRLEMSTCASHDVSTGEYMEHQIPLSASLIWKQSTSYYMVSGLSAWNSNDVPFGISSSPLIAQKYSDLIMEFSNRYPDTRCVVVEIGAGHGILSYRIAANLSRRPAVKKQPLVLMTDFHDCVFRKHLENKASNDLVSLGYLNFAVVDLMSPPDALDLFIGGENIKLRDQIVVIVANYVMDSIPADIYRGSSEGLQRALVSLKKTRNGGLPNPDCMQISFVENDVKAENLNLNLKLQSGESALVPVAGIDALNKFIDTSETPMLIIVGDKMVDSRNDSWLQGVPGMDMHGRDGCVSCCVDPFVMEELLHDVKWSYHAIDPDEAFGISLYLVKSDLPLETDPFKGFTISDFDRLKGWISAPHSSIIGTLASSEIHELFEVSQYDFDLFFDVCWKLTSDIDIHEAEILACKCFENCFVLDSTELLRCALRTAQWLYSRSCFQSVNQMATIALQVQSESLQVQSESLLRCSLEKLKRLTQ